MAFNDGSTGGLGGFDRARIETAPNRFDELSKPQYDALPLSRRIELVLQKKVKFFRNGSEVSSNQALRGF